MGCLDELVELDQGQCFIKVSTPSLENCFVKYGSRFSETKKNFKVMEGYGVVAKNPCLHPGDEDRPHTNEASGSDLDGDLYFVMWDENLIPPSKESWTPMDYAPPEVKLLPGADGDHEIPESVDFIADAWNHNCSYDGQLGLLGQYKVNREEEIVTGHIGSMPKYNSSKRGDLQEKLKHASFALRKEFRQVFEKMGSDFDQISDEKENIMYERKASAWYQVTYHPRWVKESLEMQEPNGAGETMVLSFAWIATDSLARIKIRSRGIANLQSTKPINSLRWYLADRI
ncbi:RNA-dependent RNA polymerase 6 [Actinidia rufa]|uniref:RNA-dependent RNA polymerase n=1 Tax=Actinidia rufa TaxID=165716 RepID=A0A7J0GC43_9ERIC|nr:RNA-dependent RNA polymerase 6 [Actinidia rufa]